MAEASADSTKCPLSTCSRHGPLKVFRLRGITKVIECATERHDEETLNTVKSLLDSEGEQATVKLHKTCYCSYTSKDHVKTFVAKKRKDGAIQSDAPPVARVRRSQVKEFNFKTQCLFCTQPCKQFNPKHPDRWDRVVQCERKGITDALPFKGSVLGHCEDRNDHWSTEVAMRCNSVHDLAAAEAQYHIRCYDEFRKIPLNADQTIMIDDEAMKLLIDEMYNKRKLCTWTSIELYEMYVGFDGQLTRKQMFTKLITYLGDDVLVLNIEGCASVVGFREFVGKIVKVSTVDAVDEENEDVLVRTIKKEVSSIPYSNANYDISEFTHTKTKQQTSSTLLSFISKLISNGEATKSSLSISQSIQHCMSNRHNQTALGLAVKLHHKFGSSELIHILHQHGYTVSYDEVLRFRKSAAKYVGDNVATLHQMMGLSRTVGLIFGWYDNFDLLVSTPNGRRETHAMATQFQKHPAGIIEGGNAQPGISTLILPRLTSKQTRSKDSNRAVSLLHYAGPKRVVPPAVPTGMTTGISYIEACARQASLVAAQEKDTQWLNSLNQGEDAIEWNGFNNQLAKKQGTLKPACTYMLGPLIDAPPSHPDTILTTLTYMQKSLLDMGMANIHISIDMQLFAITKQICWNQPRQFHNVIAHPGGMHIIQSFVGCIGKLMKGSGLEVYVAAAYGGLRGIFNGKSWVKAMRSFRGVAAALLERFLSTGPKSFQQIEEYLDTARLHPTGRHWVDNFLLPTLLIHEFERAEREGDFYLRQMTLERMMKYFFLAGHVQYARYLTQYLLEMRVLHPEVKKDLVSGGLVCRHRDGYWNAVSADQFGEQTAIKVGKGALKGMTLSADLVCEWIDAFPITVHVSDRMDYIYSDDSPSQSVQNQHKEEFKHRRILDASDRGLIRAEVDKYLHPLEDCRPHLYNPITGQVAPTDVNVSDSIIIGEKMENKYIASLPGGFYDPISTQIKTMHHLKNQVASNKNKPAIDLENIFLRLLMTGQQRKIELKCLFSYELCVVPPSLIDEYGCLRKGNKSALVKRLGVLQIAPTLPDIVIVDVSQLFYHIVWPHGGSPADLTASIQGRLSHYPDQTEKIIVFDKYKGVSAKDHERMRRAGEVTIDYELSITSPLPKRDVILKSKNNKKRLASILSTFCLGENIIMDTLDDGAFGHDEADVTMISYVLQAFICGKTVIRVLSDDTDVFVLLVYWVCREKVNCKVEMERWDGTVLDINATCADLGPKCLQLLGMHALSGCDTTSYPYSKGKISALNTLLDGNFPGLHDVLGETGVTQAQLMEAATPFFISLYGQPPGTSIESTRFTLFTKKRKSPKVMALPPTSSNLLQHVLRAHLQVMLWKVANHQAPPDESADISCYGWKIQDGIPAPVTVQGDTAPPELIENIQCKCKAVGKKCSTEACGCHKQQLSCTSYCNCSGEEMCCNPHTKNIQNQAAVNDPVNTDTIEDHGDENLEETSEEQEDGSNGNSEDSDDDWE